MRQVISFIFASAILCGGLYLGYLQFFHSKVIYGWGLLASSMAIAVGGAWLISDFILPLLRDRDGK